MNEEADGTPEERQMAYEHGMAVERYAVDEALCDAHFFDEEGKPPLKPPTEVPWEGFQRGGIRAPTHRCIGWTRASRASRS